MRRLRLGAADDDELNHAHLNARGRLDRDLGFDGVPVWGHSLPRPGPAPRFPLKFKWRYAHREFYDR
jgi:hypothetical protein